MEKLLKLGIKGDIDGIQEFMEECFRNLVEVSGHTFEGFDKHDIVIKLIDSKVKILESTVAFLGFPENKTEANDFIKDLELLPNCTINHFFSLDVVEFIAKCIKRLKKKVYIGRKDGEEFKYVWWSREELLKYVDRIEEVKRPMELLEEILKSIWEGKGVNPNTFEYRVAKIWRKAGYDSGIINYDKISDLITDWLYSKTQCERFRMQDKEARLELVYDFLYALYTHDAEKIDEFMRYSD